MIVLSFGMFLASSSGGRLFGLDGHTVMLIVSNLINVTILAIVLAKLLYKPVRDILHKRSERIRVQLEQAESDKANAADLKRQYEQKLEEARRECDEIIDEARKLAEDTSQRIISEAKKEAEAVRARAAENVEMEWERAQETMRLAIIDVSATMSEKFVTLAVNKDTHDRLFDETMAELEGMTWKS